MLVDKNAIITGANRGIGYETMCVLAQKGYNIWACARTQSSEFENKINIIAQENNIWVKPVYFDLSCEDDIKTGIKKIFEDKISIDVLVNNAGINHYGLLQMATLGEARKVFDINFFAPMLIMQLVVKKMIRQKKGSIINLASVAALDSHAGDSIYGASKAALISMTKSFASEVGKSGIRINAVAPGPTNTDMIQKHIQKLDKMIFDNTVSGRLAQPEEIASVIAFLASDDASFINGQVIRVDGGTK